MQSFWPLLALVFHRYIFFPLGIANGLRPVRPWKGQAPDNPILEKAFLVTRKGKLNYKQIQGLAKQLDWSERQVERWIRMRRMMDRPSTLVKFMECGWRFSYYGFAFTYGMWSLWDKDWLWDINHCWYTFPFQVNFDLKCIHSLSQIWLIHILFIILGSDKRRMVVLHDIAQFLLVSTLFYVWRYKEERFLGNVDSSLCYHHSVGFVMDMQHGSSREPSSCDTRLRRYFLGIGEDDEVYKMATYLRHIIRDLYGYLDWYATGHISILGTLQVVAINELFIYDVQSILCF